MAGTYRHRGSGSATLRHAQVGDLVGDLRAFFRHQNEVSGVPCPCPVPIALRQRHGGARGLEGQPGDLPLLRPKKQYAPLVL